MPLLIDIDQIFSISYKGSMQDRLEKLIREHGLKHWSFAARKDSEFCSWVEEQTHDLEHLNLSFPERVYTAVTGQKPVCENGSRMKFDNIERGWRRCGPAKSCACTAAAVSEALQASHTQRSAAQVAATVEKRGKTNLERYGHVNPGQTERAREGHKAFYSDPEKVARAVAKGAETMMQTYGVTNALLLPEVNEIRPTIARTLSDEAKARRQEKRNALYQQGAFLDASYAKLVEKFAASGLRFLTPREKYFGIYGLEKADRQRYEFECMYCGHQFISRIYDGAMPQCPSCYAKTASYVSNQEKAVADFIEGLGFNVIRTARNVIHNGRFSELDIYVPEKKLAIDYGGLYWHSDKDPGYHLSKFLACEAAGVRLVTLFSDEWLLQRASVEDRLRQLLGRAATRTYARQTTVAKISGSEAKAFLDDIHLQGAGRSPSICYGLRDADGTLLSVMTFGSLRKSNNHVPADGHFEMYRFASRGSVVGGASKLFHAFVNDHDPARVVTFADLRWGMGDVYRILGFEDEGRTAPGYWWVENFQVRHHRWKFRKQALVAAGFPADQTEDQIMFGRGFSKIWDCGNQRFSWTRPNKH